MTALERLRPLAAWLPEQLRSRVAFALAYSSELSLSAAAVFLRECSTAGRMRNRSELARLVATDVARSGLRLDDRTDPGAVREVVVNREYEWPGFVPSPGWTVLDIGAQHGEYSVLCAVTYRASVLAFEPLAANCEVISANVRLNGATGIRVFQLALGSSDGELRAHRYSTMIVRAPGRFPTRAASVRQARLDALGLDSAVSGREVIIKIDVEGFERQVLDGAVRFIARFRPMIIVETDQLGRAEIDSFLGANGYTVVHRTPKLTGELVFARPSDVSSATRSEVIQ